MKQTMRAAHALLMVSGRAFWRGWSATPFEHLESRTLLSGVDVAQIPAVPQGLTAVIASPGVVTLNWQAAARASGYQILRSVDGGAMTPIASIASPNQLSLQTAVQGNTLYQYEVRAFNNAGTSASSQRVQVLTPMATPTGVTAIAQPDGVRVTWVDTEPANTGFLVLRSVNGGSYEIHAQVSGGSTTSYLDTSADPGAVYYYRVMAMGPLNASLASTAAGVTVPLRTPEVTLLAGTTSMQVSWTGLDPATTTYTVMRGTNPQGPFQTLAQLDRFAREYTDEGLTPNTDYYYRVIASNAVTTSAPGVAWQTTAMAAPVSDPDLTPGMTVQMRHGTELVVTITGQGESLTVSENNGLLTLMAGDTPLGSISSPASLFVYDRAGNSTITIGGTVTVSTTIVGINDAFTKVSSEGKNVRVWLDGADSFSGLGVVHYVWSYAGGVSKALGDSLPNPSDSGALRTLTGPLFVGEPRMKDVNQGGVGDCYFVASLAAFAEFSPDVLLNAVVDLGDGTYAVRYYKDGIPVYVRVSNQVPAGPYGGYGYAQPGETGAVWAPVMEKAFAWFRDGSNTYASIAAGWMSEAYQALGVTWVDFWIGANESSFYSIVSLSLSSGLAVTLATTVNPPSLVGNHAYTLVSATMVNGAGQYVVRNPWGISGTSIEDSEGFAVLTYSDITKNFVLGTRAA